MLVNIFNANLITMLGSRNYWPHFIDEAWEVLGQQVVD